LGNKGELTECYPGLGLRVEQVRPEVESGVGMVRVHEGKTIDRGLNRIMEMELQERDFGSLPKFWRSAEVSEVPNYLG
jgi:hypothetical protein